MNINSSVAGTLDTIGDMVMLKAGLALTSNDIVRLLDRDLARTNERDWWYSPRPWLHSPPDAWVRIRAENLESVVVRVMYLVGALPTPENQKQLLFRFANNHPYIVMAMELLPAMLYAHEPAAFGGYGSAGLTAGSVWVGMGEAPPAGGAFVGVG